MRERPCFLKLWRVLGVAAATAYLAIASTWKGRTFGQALVGLLVLDARASRRVSANRATPRGVVLEIAAVPTLILAVPAVAELVSLATSGRTVTDRLLGTSVLSERRAGVRPGMARDVG